MKIILPILIVLLVAVSACEKKSSSSSNVEVEQDKPCLKGRFVGNACNGLTIVQVVEPVIDSLKESVFFNSTGSDKTEYTFVTDVPDAFKDGELFYFNLEGTFHTYVHDNACSWPKYGSVISGLSHLECASTTD
jgi:hypothetical protein